MKRILILTIVLCSAAALPLRSSSPDRPRDGMQLSMDVLGRNALLGHVQSAVPGGSGNSTVVLLDDELIIASSLHAPADLAAAGSVNDWWKRIEITIADEHGVVRKLRGNDLHLVELRVAGKAVSGVPSTYASWDSHGNVIRFSLAPLPPGDYVVRATLDLPGAKTLPSNPSFSLVRRGDEDDMMRDVSLRREAERARTYESFKRVMLQIHALEPANTSVIEDIAIRSLNTAPPAETLALFRQARGMAEASAAQFKHEHGDLLTSADRQRLDDELASLALFEKVYPTYVEHQKDRRLVVIGGGYAKKYAWIAKDGGMIGVIDLHDPSIIRPITTHEQR